MIDRISRMLKEDSVICKLDWLTACVEWAIQEEQMVITRVINTQKYVCIVYMNPHVLYVYTFHLFLWLTPQIACFVLHTYNKGFATPKFFDEISICCQGFETLLAF